MDPALRAAFDATWPAPDFETVGGFRVTRAPDGGGRLNSARVIDAWTADDIERVAALQRGRGDGPRFMVEDGDAALARALDGRGMVGRDATAILEAPATRLMELPIPPVTALTIWPPLAIQTDLWAENGIGPARRAAMDRAPGPKTALLGRIRDRAAGVGFVAVHGPVAMVHALVVPPEFRRQGVAAWLMRRAGHFATGHGAPRVALAVTRANAGALALYDRLGFVEVGGYRYFTEAPAVAETAP